ncbi:MAG: flippase-like domain-containing protein [Acidobacteria bacterium]|nr:flippase-like domain-containing protein [Acidobacteriota bacterium]
MKQRLGLSVAWGYGFGVLLMLFIFLILMPEAEGPSPWDGDAFKKGILEMAANFRILDELADLSIVKVADVGDGFLNVDLDLVGVSNRKFGWAPFWLAIFFVSAALLLRGIRQRLLAGQAGVSAATPNQISSHFFGRGLNLFFPFGPGELGTVQCLVDGGASPSSARTVVFHNRFFEVLGIVFVLAAGFVVLGWEGAIEPFFWASVIVVSVVSLTAPLGRSGEAVEGAGFLPRLWSAVNGPALVRVSKELAKAPGFLAAISLMSILLLGVEILGYWLMKQAFSSSLEGYVLMKDITLVRFAIVIAVANLARVVPYTLASLGIYELASVLMFRVFDQGYLTATTVTLLDSLLINGLTLVFFLFAWRAARTPSILETWRAFFDQSAQRLAGAVREGTWPDERTADGADAP